MADPKNIQLDQSQLKEIETQLASVEKKMQRLAILKNAIELKLIDPQEAQRFDLFVKELASVDTSNIESLRGYITGTNDQFDELIKNNSVFSKQSESSLRAYVNQDILLAGIVAKLDSAAKSTKKLNSNLDDTDSLIDSFMQGFREGLDEWYKLDEVQASIEKGMNKLKKSQKDQIKNAFGLNSNYDAVASNILEIGKNLENTGTPLSNMLQFDTGKIDKLGESIDQALSNIGQDTFTIDGQEVGAELRGSILKGLSTGGDELAKNMGDRIDRAKKVIQKKSGETQDVIDAMIKDLEAKTIDPNAQVLPPAMQGKVEAAWGRIQKAGNAALMDAIVNTSKANERLTQFNNRLIQTKYAAAAVDGITKRFGMLGRAADAALDSLQYATRDLMPNWLYQTLGLDDAFQNISNTAKTGLADAAKKIAQGASYTEAMSVFAGSFSKALLGALGPLTLIVIGVTALWNMMSAAGESVKDLSKEFGVSRKAAYDMYKDILNITAAVDNTSIKQEDVLEVLKKHRDEYGLILDLNDKANQEAVKFAAELGKQYGVGAGEAYALTQQLQRLGADKAASEEMAAVAAHASNLAGIPFNTITKDLAESSEFVAIQFARYPLEAVKAATKIRAMGSSLKQVERAMEKAFNVSEFMQNMTELNIMTRGVVDLSQMFKLSLAGDELGVAKEVGKQFDKMLASGQTSMFQLRQFANTVGSPVDELLKGNKIRKETLALGQENVDLLIKYVDNLTEADMRDAKSLAKAAKKLSATEKLDTVWASIKDTLIQALMPALEGISEIIVAIAPALKILGAIIKGLAAPLALISDVFTGIVDIIEGSTPKFERIGSIFGSWDGITGKIFNTVTAIAALWSSWKLFGSLKKVSGMFSGFMKPLEFVGKSLVSMKDFVMSLIPSFKNVLGLFSGWGDSVQNIISKFKEVLPSTEGIRESIKSWGPEIKKAIVGLKDMIPNMKGMFSKLRDPKTFKDLGAKIKGVFSKLKDPKTFKDLGTRLKGAFSKLKDPKTYKDLAKGLKTSTSNVFSKLKDPQTFKKAGSSLKGMFSATAAAAGTLMTTDAGKAASVGKGGKGGEPTLFDKGLDTVLEMTGLKEEDDPLQASADALSEAASALQDAASTLSQCPCPGNSAMDRGRRRGGRRGRRGAGGRGGTRAGRGGTQRTAGTQRGGGASRAGGRYRDPVTGRFAQAPAQPRTVRAPQYRDPVTGRFAKAPGGLAQGGRAARMAGSVGRVGGSLIKGIGVGAIAGLAGEGLNYLGSKYEEKAMETGDAGELTKGRLAKTAGTAASYAGTGALIGSIIPGVGNAVGAAVGGVIGGAVGIWENFFSDDSKKQDEQLELMKTQNKYLNGLNKLTEDEIMQLKEAGYSDEVIQKISNGNISLETAIKEQFSELNLNDDQLKQLTNPKTTPQERDAIMQAASGVETPSLAVGTNMVKSDGLAMLHKGESVIPADIVQGGFDLKKFFGFDGDSVKDTFEKEIESKNVFQRISDSVFNNDSIEKNSEKTQKEVEKKGVFSKISDKIFGSDTIEKIKNSEKEVEKKSVFSKISDKIFGKDSVEKTQKEVEKKGVFSNLSESIFGKDSVEKIKNSEKTQKEVEKKGVFSNLSESIFGKDSVEKTQKEVEKKGMFSKISDNIFGKDSVEKIKNSEKTQKEVEKKGMFSKITDKIFGSDTTEKTQKEVEKKGMFSNLGESIFGSDANVTKENSIQIPSSITPKNNEINPDIASKVHKAFNISNDLIATPEPKISKDNIITSEIKPEMSTPINNSVAPAINEISDVNTPIQASGDYASAGNEYGISSRSSGNQDAMLKQLMSAIQSVASRPVEVQIGGVELKSLNKKFKVLNNMP